MTALLAALVLASTPALDAFWARDLGALARAAPGDPLGEDLYAFLTCAPLPPLSSTASADLSRQLLRLEQARWSRLRGELRGTVFADLARTDFFLRSSTPFKADKLLEWPAETERWPDEVPVVEVPASACAQPEVSANELELIDQLLVREAELPKPLAAKLHYEAAVLSLARNDSAAARRHAEALHGDELDPPLRFHAELLRTLTSARDAATLADLAAKAPPKLALDLSLHAGYAAAKSGDWAAASRAVLAAGTGQPTVTLYALVAADRQGNVDSLKTSLQALSWPEGSDRSSTLLRSIAVDIATRVMSGAELAELQKKWDGQSGAPSIEALAYSVIARQRFDAARELAVALESGQRKKKAAQLSVELLFLTGDKRFAEELISLVDGAEAKLPGSGERAAKQLARRLALNASKNPSGWRGFTAFVQKRFDVANQKSWQEALSLAEAQQVVVASGGLALPEPPPLEVVWPPVHSLLLLPAPDGSLRSWFGEEVARAQ